MMGALERLSIERRRWQQCTKPPEQTVKPALDEGTRGVSLCRLS